MLTDAQVDRYSRQIVLPEVGARGQERLLAARVALAGDGPAATIAAMLLGRAGVGALHVDERLGTLPELAPDCRVSRGRGGQRPDVAVTVTERASGAERPEPGTPVVLGVLGARVVVATLVWRSCLGCFGDAGPLGADALPAAAAHAARLALGALAANEALRILLRAPTRSRLTLLDVARGTAVVNEIEPVGCRLCAIPA